MRNKANEMAFFPGNGDSIIAKYSSKAIRCSVAIESNSSSIKLLIREQNAGKLAPFPIWEGNISTFDPRYFFREINIVSGFIHDEQQQKIGIKDTSFITWQQMHAIAKEIESPYIVLGVSSTDLLESILDFLERQSFGSGGTLNYYEIENIMVDYSSEVSALGHWIVLYNAHYGESDFFHENILIDDVNFAVLKMVANRKAILDENEDSLMGNLKMGN